MSYPKEYVHSSHGNCDSLAVVKVMAGLGSALSGKRDQMCLRKYEEEKEKDIDEDVIMILVSISICACIGAWTK